MFVAELRRPIVRGESYHPIIIVSPEEPHYWKSIKVTYNDVYYLKGSLVRSAVFARANATRAFAVVLLASRDGVTKVEEETIDSGTLFAYLKLEQNIPRFVFFTVELTCSSNMAGRVYTMFIHTTYYVIVLNATIMRRVKRQQLVKHNLDGGNKIAMPGPKVPIVRFNILYTLLPRLSWRYPRTQELFVDARETNQMKTPVHRDNARARALAMIWKNQ